MGEKSVEDLDELLYKNSNLLQDKCFKIGKFLLNAHFQTAGM